MVGEKELNKERNANTYGAIINKLVKVFANPIPKSPVAHNREYQLYNKHKTFNLRPFTAHWRHYLSWSSNYYRLKGRIS